VGTRDYGQVCGLAHALDLVGERWGLLVVRELILGPKRFTDLRNGLPRIPTNVLSTRLKELERGGVVRRRASPSPGGSIVYELTEYGQELEDVVVRLGLWGAKTMGEPRAGDTLSADSLRLALRAMFDADRAAGVRARYVVRAGEAVVHADVDRGRVAIGEGPLADPDLELEADPAALLALFTGELAPADAIRRGEIRIVGDAALLERFAELFSLETRPVARTPAASAG
jgi:DNA-binding HxlR family transcriptional regulator